MHPVIVRFNLTKSVFLDSRLMCLIVCNIHKNRHYPVIVGANRDEYYERPSQPPQVLNDRPKIIGGYDVRKGGTWLGVNEYGLVAAITNYDQTEKRNPEAESRGILCLKALGCENARAAVENVRKRLEGTNYNPFTLLLMDRHNACSISNMTTPAVADMSAGWHILGNGGLDDPDEPKIRRVHELLNSEKLSEPSSLEITKTVLKKICRDHGNRNNPADEESACFHGASAGTRSSSIIAVDSNAQISAYLHAEGFPCKNEYKQVQV